MTARDVLRVAAIVGLHLSTACTSGLAPEDRVETTLVATPTSLELGDTVRLLGIAHNATSSEIQPESGCAPGIGFYVVNETGVEMSLYDGIGSECGPRDSQTIGPGETDSVLFSWVPTASGLYQVRSALVFDGPRSPSEAIPITVH